MKKNILLLQSTANPSFQCGITVQYNAILSFQFLKKVQRQDRIVEEVKLVLKPAYNTRRITKEAYKEILRKTVPKVCIFLFQQTGLINTFFLL